jgi:transposase
MEACGGAHHWARERAKLGHTVRLIPPQHVKPYVGRGRKNDAADAEALCEAMSRPKIRQRFVAVKTEEQQAELMLVSMRDRLVRTRTQLTNAIRGHAAEFGLIAARGLGKIEVLLERIAADETLPPAARELFVLQGEEYARVEAGLQEIDTRLKAWHRQNEVSRRLAEIPGIGPIGAVMLAMKAPDPAGFASGRQFAAWIGLTPKDHSTAGKVRHGGITRAGDEALRRVLVVGATAVIQQAQRGRGRRWPWLVALMARKPAKLAAVALANKMARIAWRLMVSGEAYDPRRGLPLEAEAA